MSTKDSLIDDLIKDKLELIGPCLVQGELYECGDYPALLKGKRSIEGELFKIIDESVMPILDEYEATDNNHPDLAGFTRERVELIKPSVMAWVYFYDGKLSEDLLITENRWSG